jgi:hypothetical protein
MERETGIEPATNSLEGCDSTTELLPLSFDFRSEFPRTVRSRFRLPAPASLTSAKTSILEPMTRIELVTSPLPRECSTN